MPLPNVAALRMRFERDPELGRAVRFWTGALYFQADSARSALRFENGRLAEAGPSAAPPGPGAGETAGAPGGGGKPLAPLPPPFSQDVFGASLPHPVSLGGDVETLYAYYPAIRRVLE